MPNIPKKVIDRLSSQVPKFQRILKKSKDRDINEAELATAVIEFPEHLRFGVPTASSRVLAAGGVRHRRTAVALGLSPESQAVSAEDGELIFATARQLLEDGDRWLPILGSLVLGNTINALKRPRLKMQTIRHNAIDSAMIEVTCQISSTMVCHKSRW